MKYPNKIQFDLKGIYLSIFLIALVSSVFIYYANKFSQIGYMYVLLGVYAFLIVYVAIVFIRTWWSAISFKDDCIIDNHQLLGVPRTIRREKLISIELKETYTKRGLSRYIEVKQKGVRRAHYILDDRIDCTIDELYEWMTNWKG